jgi:hypothetical protein
VFLPLLRSRLNASHRQSAQRLSEHRSHPCLERLEERCLLATVTNLNDSGPGSLRDALAATPAGGTVDFVQGLSGTIILTSGELDISNDLTIEGPGADVITVSGNHASRVFDIANFTVAIAGLTIADGSVTNSSGGGIINLGTLAVTDSAFSGNNGSSGGGIDNAGMLTVTDSTFTGNFLNTTFGFGGGIFNFGTSAITDSTFSGNSAVEGGGIYNDGTLTVTDSTFSGNSAKNANGGGLGGGIYNDSSFPAGTVNIRNTLLAGNNAPSGGPDVDGPLNSLGYNLIGNGSAGSGYVATDLVGTSASPIDPQLGMLQDNGGPTRTMALLPGSPALDAGDPAQLGQADQRGVVRSGGVNIGAYQASASLFQITGVPAQVTAGVPFDVTVTADDEFNQLAVGYTGTVDLTSSDSQAAVPGEYTFALGDGGTHTFSGGFTLLTPGTQTITATDPSSGVTGSATITVTPQAAQLVLSAPASATAGSPFDITVTAVDSNGNVVPGYTGTVAFSSTDPYPAVLPATYTFSSSNQGVHTFTSGVTLFTAGVQALTVQDTAKSSITGSTTITISPASASALRLHAPATAVAGTAFNVTVTAFDAYGNVATGYSGTVLLASSDRTPQLSDYTFTPSDNGAHSFALTLFTAGVQTVLASDAANGSISETIPVTVQAATPFDLLVTVPSSVVAGTPFDVIVSALDRYGNTATNYQGTVTFGSSDTDPGVMLPGAYTFTTGSGGDNGVHDFVAGATLVTAGDQTITATDAANAITGNAAVLVSAPPTPPPGGGASGLRTPITNGVGPAAQQVVLLDHIFSSLGVKNPPFALVHAALKRLADDPFGLGDEVIGSGLL